MERETGDGPRALVKIFQLDNGVTEKPFHGPRRARGLFLFNFFDSYETMRQQQWPYTSDMSRERVSLLGRPRRDVGGWLVTRVGGILSRLMDVTTVVGPLPRESVSHGLLLPRRGECNLK